MPVPSTFAALVFDFDGLVVDTETPIFVSWQWAFEAHGVEPLTHDEWSAQVGTVAGLDIEGILAVRAGRVDPAILDERLRKRDQVTALQPVRPGVVDWLDEADDLGLDVAIASSSTSDWVLGHLDRLGLRERFGPVLCRSAAHRPKPAPDLYRAACEELRVDPTQALAIEDSPAGIAAAKAAGLRCLAVPNQVTVGMDLSAADDHVASLAELSLEQVLVDFS